MKKFNDLLRKAKFNNTGSTLIVVAVCVMFIGILAVTMLMTSYMNYQMKITDRLSTVNFHSAEGALDQASAGLKVQSEKSLEEAFDYAEKYYAATPQKERTNLINKRYVTEYFGKLASAAGIKENSAAKGSYVTQVSSNIKGERYVTLASSGGGTSGDSQEKKFCDHLKTLTLEGVDSNSSVRDRVSFSAGDGGNIVIAYNTEDYYIEVKNLKITYTDDKDYQTTITTDIRLTPPVSVPEDYFTSSTMKNSIVDDYAIIADGTVSAVTGGDSTVDGNVYSGGGISAPSSTLTLKSDIVASRRNLNAKGSGRIKVNAGKTDSAPQVWVKNILTSLSDGAAGERSATDSTGTGSGTAAGGTSGASSSITVNGDCYVADDLIMNNPDHSVTVNGNYYGYNTGSSTSAYKNRYDGSAIGINASGADLNITGKLWLAGLNILEDTSYINSNETAKVKEGESLSYKWTQSAYLITGECIVGADGQNPMPASVFDKLTHYNAANGTRGKLDLNFMNYPFITQINIEEYLDKDDPYTYKYVQQYDGATSENVVYLYMNFTDESTASMYFARYASYLTQRTALTAAANILGYGKVKLSDDVLNGKDGKFSGNILLFDKDETQAPGAGTGTGTSSSGSSYKNTFDQREDTNKNESDGSESDPFRDSVTSPNDSILIEDRSSSGRGSSDGGNDQGDTGNEGESGNSDGDKPDTTRSYTPFGSMTLAESNRSVHSPEMVNYETECNYKYNGLISLLDSNIYTSYPAYKLVANMFTSKGLVEDEDNDVNVIYVPERSKEDDGTELTYTKKDLPLGNENKTVLVKGGAGMNKGIVIADRDVVVSGNFNGTIITTGNVTLQGNVTVKAEYTAGFDNIAKPEQTSETSERVKVTYRNWKKNK